MTLEEARRYRKVIEKGIAKLGIDEIGGGVELNPMWREDDVSVINAGTRIQWNGAVKIALVDVVCTAANRPSDALEGLVWATATFRDGYRVIPTTMITATMFHKDGIGWWQDKKYKSLIDNNSWNPTDYPAGWEEVI